MSDSIIQRNEDLIKHNLKIFVFARFYIEI